MKSADELKSTKQLVSELRELARDERQNEEMQRLFDGLDLAKLSDADIAKSAELVRRIKQM